MDTPMNTEPQIALLPSRGVIAVSGPEARTFLQDVVTNNVDRVGDGNAVYAALLTPQGKLMFDFFMIDHDGAILLDCHGAFLPDLLKRLTMYRLRAKADIEDVSERWHVAAVWGGNTDLPGSAFTDPRLAALGRRALVPRHETIRTNATEAEYNAWRLGLGVPDVPADAGQDQTFMLEANFDELNGVDFDKGCYIGQELASRMKRRGGLKKRLLPVDVEGELPPPETPVLAGERNVGNLRTGIGKRAMAYLRIDRLEEENGVQLTAGGVPLTVDWPNWIPR